MSSTLRITVLQWIPSRSPLQVPALIMAVAGLMACGASQRQYATPAMPEANAAGILTVDTPLAKTLLVQLDTLANGAQMRATTGRAVAGPSYVAANGRTCRSVLFEGKTPAQHSMLACMDTAHWFFVPGITTGSTKEDIPMAVGAPQ